MFILGLNAAKTHFMKKASNKSSLKLNFAQKSPRVHMPISPTSGVWGYKDQYVWNLIMYRNGKLDPLWGSMLPKIRILQKKGSDKSSSESNFV